MNTSDQFALVYVTAPDPETARRLARAALEKRLAACANLIPRVESHYWWQGQLESGDEVLILFKTERRHLERLEELILAEHPYDTPEFLVSSLTGGTAKYLEWLAQSVKPL